MSAAEQAIHVVFLPDRDVPPFRFEGSALNKLIARTDRSDGEALASQIEEIGAALAIDRVTRLHSVMNLARKALINLSVGNANSVSPDPYPALAQL